MLLLKQNCIHTRHQVGQTQGLVHPGSTSELYPTLLFKVTLHCVAHTDLELTVFLLQPPEAGGGKTNVCYYIQHALHEGHYKGLPKYTEFT